MEEGVGRDVGGEESGLTEPATAARAKMQLPGQPVLDAALALAAALFDFELFRAGTKLAAGSGRWRRRWSWWRRWWRSWISC